MAAGLAPAGRVTEATPPRDRGGVLFPLHHGKPWSPSLGEGRGTVNSSPAAARSQGGGKAARLPPSRPDAGAPPGRRLVCRHALLGTGPGRAPLRHAQKGP